ncbi:hypothetical protein HN789_04970 [archaeon]|jgi:hypothetical protein|nr:hypothetical protein [archaeon]MBT4022864.1 hypothetical protein [archaeon]MBT4272511.1 hypothetical protein [archaeon]MBT4460421.1 hypothetical protein [archaeon]MBT4859052.1 hypothetical protein [archaeon]
MTDEKIIDILLVLHDFFNKHDVSYVVASSLSLALQGVDINSSDIDLYVDQQTAEKLKQLFLQIPKIGVKREIAYSEGPDSVNPIYKSFFGTYELMGVEIDIMGELEEKTINGEWVTYAHRLINPPIVKIKDREIPVSNLEDQLKMYSNSTREEDKIKVEKIKSYLDSKQ